MFNELREAIQAEYNLSEEVAIYITKYVIDEYELEDITDEDIEHILNNLYIYGSTLQVVTSITESTSAYSAIVGTTSFIVRPQDLNKPFIHVWLEQQGYQKVGIENSDIWFTMIEY